MEKIYKQAKDEHVACVMVYAKVESIIGGDAFVAYKDDAKTERFTVAELIDAFQKGCVITINNLYYVKPVQCMSGNETGLEIAGLIGYYNNSQEEDGTECTPLQVITWDGELPSDLGE